MPGFLLSEQAPLYHTTDRFGYLAVADSRRWRRVLSLVGTIGYGALAALVCGWLVVSFARPGPLRTLVEWVSACAMYLALLMLFTHLTLRAQASDNLFALLAFGFLCLMFGTGFGVCSYHALTTLRRSEGPADSATN